MQRSDFFFFWKSEDCVLIKLSNGGRGGCGLVWFKKEKKKSLFRELKYKQIILFYFILFDIINKILIKILEN